MDSFLAYPCTYLTRKRRIAVICTCKRRVLITPSGLLFRHSPIEGGGWCPKGATPLSELRP